MKIAILLGSPRYQTSITLQYVLFLKKKFPLHEFCILQINRQIKNLEENQAAFQTLLDQVKGCQLVVWASPVYITHIPGPFKRFIELIWERKATEIFKNKYAAVLLTCNHHFFDDIAQDYLHAICDDLEMKYIDSYSASMFDLFEKIERDRILEFAANLFEVVANNQTTFPVHRPVVNQSPEYNPGPLKAKVDIGDKRVLILTDAENENTNEWRMVNRIRNSFSGPLEFHNLNDLDIKGGCQGCARCGYDHTCFWKGKDAYNEFFETQIKTADILIFSGTIKDRYLSSRWKTFWDRSFYNNHMPTMKNKHVGWIISGPFSSQWNLKRAIEIYFQLQPSRIAAFVTDEYEYSAEIDDRLDHLAKEIVRLSQDKRLIPVTFAYTSGMKFFRDMLLGNPKMIFQSEYKYFKKHGLFKKPKRDFATRILSLVLKHTGFRNKNWDKVVNAHPILQMQKIIEKEPVPDS